VDGMDIGFGYSIFWSLYLMWLLICMMNMLLED
jgi:hypothetical protein